MVDLGDANYSVVPKQLIFKGPLILVGSGPFKIDLQPVFKITAYPNVRDSHISGLLGNYETMPVLKHESYLNFTNIYMNIFNRTKYK